MCAIAGNCLISLTLFSFTPVASNPYLVLAKIKFKAVVPSTVVLASNLIFSKGTFPL